MASDLEALLVELMALDHVLHVYLESPNKLGEGVPARFSDEWACFVTVLYPADEENPSETDDRYEHGATPLEAVRKVYEKYGPSRGGGWEAVR